MKLKDIILEKKSEKKEDKIYFVETNPQEPFPSDTINYLRKEINKLTKDLSIDWKKPVDVLNAAFSNLNIPIPQAHLKERWQQYLELIAYVVKNLADSRGFAATWSG